jgi:SAM-dependent methyltransferase
MTKSRTDADVVAGQAVYTDRSLKYYDLFVLSISNRWIWKCPSRHLEELYNECVAARHLDIGVGTGYFLDRCRFPETPEITLLDLNEASLAAAAKRIEGYSPKTVTANVLEPLPLGERTFDSVGLNYLLHCIPGDLKSKGCVFDHLLPHLNPGGIVFGSTLLSHGVKRGFLARKLMAFYNRKGIFHNQQDSLTDLEESLNERFDDVRIDVIGSAALFRASTAGDELP